MIIFFTNVTHIHDTNYIHISKGRTIVNIYGLRNKSVNNNKKRFIQNSL